MKKHQRFVVFLAGFFTIALSIFAFADFTVGKPMYEAFQMFNADGSARTNCDLTKFTTKMWINDVPTTMTWTFRNQSTGDYDATATPTTVGDYKLAIFYNNTIVGTFTDMARLWDIDTMYGSAGPRMANISSNLSGAVSTTIANNVYKTFSSISKVINRPHSPGGF